MTTTTEGFAVSTDDFEPVCIQNDVGGTSMLPPGRYRVRVTRQWEDYETGTRMVGELLDEADHEAARLAGTTGHAEPGTEYAPTTVYFSGRQFEAHGGPDDLAALIRKLVECGVDYTPSTRYGGWGSAGVRGYDPHGTVNLTHAEEDLLRQVLGYPNGDE